MENSIFCNNVSFKMSYNNWRHCFCDSVFWKNLIDMNFNKVFYFADITENRFMNPQFTKHVSVQKKCRTSFLCMDTLPIKLSKCFENINMYLTFISNILIKCLYFCPVKAFSFFFLKMTRDNIKLFLFPRKTE